MRVEANHTAAEWRHSATCADVPEVANTPPTMPLSRIRSWKKERCCRRRESTRAGEGCADGSKNCNPGAHYLLRNVDAHGLNFILEVDP